MNTGNAMARRQKPNQATRLSILFLGGLCSLLDWFCLGQSQEGRDIQANRSFTYAVTVGEPVLRDSQGPANASQNVSWINSLGMKFVPVPGTKVLFSIWETRVADFRQFVEDKANNGGYHYQRGSKLYGWQNGSWIQPNRDYGWENPGFEQTAEHPVTCVSWEDAKTFCMWLTKKELGEGKIKPGQAYRLPMDEEWSYAVGLGGLENGNTPADKSRKTKDVYPWGNQWPPPDGAGNFDDYSIRKIPGYSDGFERTAPVGSFKPNQFGIFDLSGNVWEWCEDWYNSEQKDRVLRGGSWKNFDIDFLLSSTRNFSVPDDRLKNSGFRIVLVGASVR